MTPNYKLLSAQSLGYVYSAYLLCLTRLAAFYHADFLCFCNAELVYFCLLLALREKLLHAFVQEAALAAAKRALENARERAPVRPSYGEFVFQSR